MYRKLWKSLDRIGSFLFLLVLSFSCCSHVLCSQIKSAAAEEAQSYNHHHHHHQHQQQEQRQHHQQHFHVYPSGNSDGTSAATNKKNSYIIDGVGNGGGGIISSASKLPPWSIPEQGIGKRNKDVEQGLCRYRRCGIGKKCVVNSFNGQAECSCVLSCKREGKSNKPVCGTDGRLYPSYCDLRRTACLTGTHIFFSHYQHQTHQQQQEKYHHHQHPQQQHQHHYYHDKVYHDGRYQHRQKDFSTTFGSDGGKDDDGDESRNRNATYIRREKHNNIIIPSSRGDPGTNQDPQCFPVVQPNHHHQQYHQQTYHRYHHHHQHQQQHNHYHHYDPDKNPLRDKNEADLQPKSPLELSSSSSSTLQHSKFLRNDEIHSGEFEYGNDDVGDENDDDDDDEDEDDDEDIQSHHNSRSVVSIGTITTTTQTATTATAAAATLGENGDDDPKDEEKSYTQNEYDEKADDDDYDDDIDVDDDDESNGISGRNGNSKGSSSSSLEARSLRSQQQQPQEKRQHHHHRDLHSHQHHDHPHHQDFTVDYPSDIISDRGQKRRKISSNGRNAQVDSRHISEHGHSDVPLPPPSSYYDFMDISSKDGEENGKQQKQQQQEQEQKGMKGETRSDFEMRSKLEFGWGKEEKDDDGENDEETSSKALFLGDDGEKSRETLQPSAAAATNLAWKLLQQEEISSGGSSSSSGSRSKTVHGAASRKNSNNNNKNGHWDDPVKKSSSFLSRGRKTHAAGDDDHVYRTDNFNFGKEGVLLKDSASSFQSTISHKSAAGEEAGGSTPSSPRHNVCSPQDYEILKAELFQYDMSKLMNHIKLMTSVSNDAVADDSNDDNASGGGGGGVASKRRRWGDGGSAAVGTADDAAAAFGRYPREVVSSSMGGGDDDNDGYDGEAPWSDMRRMMMMTATTSSPPQPLSPSPPPPWLNMEGDGPEADKDNLLRHIFTLLDRNHDSVLEYIELYKAEMEDLLQLYSPEKTGCQLRDFLLFDDSDHDGQLFVNEFFSSFSHFYDITMISLDKALETKLTRVVEGDSVVLHCDITGSPPPYIQWKRYGTALSQLASPGMKSNIDGTLSLTNVHMIHAGHYSCQSPRNPEVVQTHIVEVETQPYVVITPKASWKRPGEDLLLICRLVYPITDLSSAKQLATGHSTTDTATNDDDAAVVASINWVWLFNGVPLRQLPKSDNGNNNNNNNNNKYIFENATSSSLSSSSFSENTAGISRLRLQEIYFQDMGSYECQAENAAGIGSATASLVVIDPNSKPEVHALHNTNAKQLLVFHRNGLASYSAENCGWLWEIFGDDVLQSAAKTGKDAVQTRAVCAQFHSECDWGNAVQVSPNYVYVAQPSQNRVLLVDVGAAQSVGNAVGIIETCANINRMEYVPYTDQIWIRCEAAAAAVVDHQHHHHHQNREEDDDKRQTAVLFSVVENASKGDHHKAIQFPLQRDDATPTAAAAAPGGEGPVRITEIYLPSHQDGKRGKKDCQFAFVSLSDEQSLRKIDLKTFTYHKNSYLNLTKFSCIPHQIHFSLSCTITIINCLDPQRKTPNGQLIVDTLSNSVRYKTTEISGISIVSSDNRILLTENHVENNTHLFVQRIGVYEINLLSHFLLSSHYTNIRVVHSTLTGAYATVAKLSTGKEVVISLQTGEVQSVDALINMVPHNSRATALYPADSAFPLKTERSVIVMDAETLRPRCKFYEEIPELQSFLTVQS